LQEEITNAVYVLDPDEAIRDGVRVLLESLNIEVRTYADGESFLQGAAPTARGCVLIENQLPDTNGLALLSRIRGMGNGIPVLLLTSSRDRGLDRHAREQGAECVLHKPMVGEQLLQRLAFLLSPTPYALTPFRR